MTNSYKLVQNDPDYPDVQIYYIWPEWKVHICVFVSSVVIGYP